MIRCFLIPLFLGFVLGLQASSLPRHDTLPLLSAAPDGLGMIALHNTHSAPIGLASISKGKRPDLFMTGSGGQKYLAYFKYLRDQEDGTPIFEKPRNIDTPATEKGFIFQTKDGRVHGYWVVKGDLLHAIFHEDIFGFEEHSRISLKSLKMPKTPQALSVIPNEDATVDIVCELADDTPAWPHGSRRWESDWRPYDDKGNWAGNRPYRYLHSVKLSSVDLGKAKLLHSKQASISQREIYFRIGGFSAATLRPGQSRDFISSSRLGLLYYFPNAKPTDSKAPIVFNKKLLIADEDGNAIRDTATSGCALTYPNPRNGLSDILVAGEGTLNYYQFTGNFTPAGAPIYKNATKALQTDAELLSGALPTPTVVDWDGDGKLDILVGNSEGLIVFHKNTGSNDKPAFTESSYIRLADGRLLHVEAGYSGSVQGLQEAHWGYLSPNVFDWNNDGLPDILIGDITGDYRIYINRGSKEKPSLDPAHPIYCDGIPLHGVWRCRPAAARVGERSALIIADDRDTLHLYWRIDDYNVEDGGIIKLDDGSPITVSGAPGGASGRCKLDYVDWDGDGKLDLIIGTGRRNAIPNPKNGYPFAALGPKTPGTVLFMKNVGSNKKPVFQFPIPLKHKITGELIQPGGAHESGAVATSLGGKGPNLLAGDEAGRLYLYLRKNLEWGKK